jgi:hypothetical protein
VTKSQSSQRGSPTAARITELAPITDFWHWEEIDIRPQRSGISGPADG